MESLKREGTLKFRFPRGAKLPTTKEMLQYMKGTGLSQKDVEAAYMSPADHGFMVKFVTEKKKENVLKKLFNDREPEKKVFKYESGVSVDLEVMDADEKRTYVRVFHLPFELEMELVGTELGKYGRICRMEMERHSNEWDFPVFSSTRGVWMIIERELPQYISVDGHRGRLYYKGQRERCFICSEEGHKRTECPMKPVFDQEFVDELNLGLNGLDVGAVGAEATAETPGDDSENENSGDEEEISTENGEKSNQGKPKRKKKKGKKGKKGRK